MKQQQDSDDSMQSMMFAGAAIIIAIIAIMSQMDKILTVIGAVAWVHVWPVAEAVRNVPSLLSVPGLGNLFFGPCAMAHDLLLDTGLGNLGIAERNMVLTASGRVALLVYGPAIIYIALRGHKYRVDKAYRRLHDIESMIRVQSQDWTASRMARNLNPLESNDITARDFARRAEEKMASANMPVLTGRFSGVRPDAWHRSMRPEEWLISSGIACDAEARAKLEEDGVSQPRSYEFRHLWETLDIDDVAEVLAEQLRMPWRGPMALPVAFRAIYAVMTLFYAYKSKEANALLGDLGILSEYAAGKPGAMTAAIKSESGLLSRIDTICASREGANLAKIGDNHAWVESAMPAMLRISRENRGVLASASFLWLKAEDRTMWYILNNCGGEAASVEAAGALAHSLAETQYGMPIRRPAVYQAARALIFDYLDMSEERITKRRDRAHRMRSPAQRIREAAAARRAATAREAAGQDDGKMGA